MKSTSSRSRAPRPVIVPVRVPTPTPPPEPTSWEMSSIGGGTCMLQRSMSEASFSLLQLSMRANNVQLPESHEDPRLQVLKQIGEMLDAGHLPEGEASEALALAMRNDDTFMLMRSLFLARRSLHAKTEFLRMWLQAQRQQHFHAYPNFHAPPVPYPYYGYPMPAGFPPAPPAGSFVDDRQRVNQSMRHASFFPQSSPSPSPPGSTRSASPAMPAVSKHADLFFAPLRN